MTARKRKARPQKEAGPLTLKEALDSEAAAKGNAIRIMALHRFIELGGGRLLFDDPEKENKREPGRPDEHLERAWQRRCLILAAAATCAVKGLAIPPRGFSGEVAALCRALAEMVADEVRTDGRTAHDEFERDPHGRLVKKRKWYVVKGMFSDWTPNVEKADHVRALLDRYGPTEEHEGTAAYEALRAAEAAYVTEELLEAVDRGDDDLAAEVLQRRALTRSALSAGHLPKSELRAPVKMELPKGKKGREAPEDDEGAAFQAILDMMPERHRPNPSKDSRVKGDGTLMPEFDSTLVQELGRQIDQMLGSTTDYAMLHDPRLRHRARQPAHPLRGIGEWELSILRCEARRWEKERAEIADGIKLAERLRKRQQQ